VSENGSASGTNDWFSVPTIAAELGLSRQSIYNLIENEELPAFRLGGSYRIRGADFREYLATHKVGRVAGKQGRLKLSVKERLRVLRGEK